jgi:hypothetical protein
LYAELIEEGAFILKEGITLTHEQCFELEEAVRSRNGIHAHSSTLERREGMITPQLNLP